MSLTMSRQAQRMLADLGFEKIENDELTIGPVKLLLSRRGIDLLNCQANELEGQFPIRGRAGPSLPVEPTDDMLTAGTEVRVNLRFQNQGISGFLNKLEVREIYQRMLNATPTATTR